MKFGEALKRFWNFVWKDDSLLSWIVSLILAFVIIKFIFFPLLSFIFSTSLPLVIVESSSMHHPGNFIGNTIGLSDAIDVWWEKAKDWYIEKGITREDITFWNFRTGMEKGDIIFVRGIAPEKLKVGDVIIFEAGQAHPIIHRIIKITEDSEGFVIETKGDNNTGQLPVEKHILKDQIIGKAIFKLPKLGWIKLVFVEIFS